MTRLRVAGVLLLAAAVTACGETASAPGGTGGGVSSSMALVLDAPDEQTGALLLSISGGPVDSVVGVDGMSVTAGITAGETQLVIAGSLPRSGIAARIYVPQGAAADYRAVVLQAADAVSYERRAPSAYHATLTP